MVSISKLYMQKRILYVSHQHKDMISLFMLYISTLELWKSYTEVLTTEVNVIVIFMTFRLYLSKILNAKHSSAKEEREK